MRTNWLCRCGKERESEEHITKVCQTYDDIRDNFEALNDDIQLASFFSKVLERRGLIDAVDQGEEEDENLAARAADVIARLGSQPNRADHVVQTV